MVAVVQTAGETLAVNPHVHALAPRGGWDAAGQWVPIPYVDTNVAEWLFRHKVLSFLKAEDLLSEERAALLLAPLRPPHALVHSIRKNRIDTYQTVETGDAGI